MGELVCVDGSPSDFGLEDVLVEALAGIKSPSREDDRRGDGALVEGMESVSGRTLGKAVEVVEAVNGLSSDEATARPKKDQLIFCWNRYTSNCDRRWSSICVSVIHERFGSPPIAEIERRSCFYRTVSVNARSPIFGRGQMIHFHRHHDRVQFRPRTKATSMRMRSYNIHAGPREARYHLLKAEFVKHMHARLSGDAGRSFWYCQCKCSQKV